MKNIDTITALNDAMDAMELSDARGPAHVMGPMAVNIDGAVANVMVARLSLRGAREKAFLDYFQKITGMGVVHTGRLRKQMRMPKARHLFILADDFARLNAGQITMVKNCVRLWEHGQTHTEDFRIAA